MVALWPVEHASHARDLIKSRVKQASQFTKSQTAVLTTERHFTLSVVHLIVECTKDSIRVTKKKPSDSRRPAWLEMDQKVCRTTLNKK